MTLYIAQAAGSDAAALEQARLVQEGFSWGAFTFGWIWLLYNRLWVALLVWAVFETGFFIFVAPHVAGPVAAAIDGLAHLFLGLEGNRLRLRADAPVSDVIEARDRDEAEAIFFRRALGETQA